VAQSEALTGKPLANYWMHNGYIKINNEKMSKSLGNGILVKDLRKEFKKEAIRYFMLSTHYRNPLNFNAETMDQAMKSVERIANAVSNLKHRLETVTPDGHGPVREELQQKLDGILKQYYEKMDDDFNTPDAITAMFEWVNEANQLLQEPVANPEELKAMLNAFEVLNAVLRLYAADEAELLDEEVESLIAERVQARKDKNWGRADEIRDLLAAQGIVLEDTAQGMRWRRK
jgi:cysteinyl-tRNA synthetase